jgi:glutaredoxin
MYASNIKAGTKKLFTNKSSSHLKANWNADESISSPVIFINSDEKHLKSIPGIPLRQQ